VNTFQWFQERTYYLEETHDPFDRKQAFHRSLEQDRLPLGIFYINPDKPTFGENMGIYSQDKTPLIFREEMRTEKLMRLFNSKK
jgi:2-oxoglutarate ferredoxin oxidoreductase subunit beta